MPDGPALIIALFVAGFVLVAAEVFLPGAILGILGGLCFAGAVTVVFLHHGASAGLAAALIVALFAVVGFLLWLYLFPRSFVGRRIILSRSQPANPVPFLHREMVGVEGVAITPLRPAGTARLGERRVDVTTAGEFIREGENVVVVAADGMRIVVRRKDGLEPGPASA